MKDFRKFNRKLEIVESLGGYRLPNICEQQQAVLHIIERAESNRGADREWTCLLYTSPSPRDTR